MRFPPYLCRRKMHQAKQQTIFKQQTNLKTFRTMAVFYKLYQDNRRNSNHQGEWYARAVHTGTVDIDDLAEEMQANCTVNMIQYFYCIL